MKLNELNFFSNTEDRGIDDICQGLAIDCSFDYVAKYSQQMFN